MILLTGVTGKIGGETAKQLVKKGASVRALVRDEAKAAELKAAGVELVVGDIADAKVVGFCCCRTASINWNGNGSSRTWRSRPASNTW